MRTPNPSLKRIPYGISDYGRLQRANGYYVDKTHYIPLIEAAPFYLFCIRPRRMGKSLWLSLLQHYYDVNQAESFDELFGETYIGQNPTPDRNSYMVLFLNFAMVSSLPDQVQSSFAANINNEIDDFLTRYARFYSGEELAYIQNSADVQTRLQRIFYHATRKQLKIYLFIDEYDNFTNTILTNQGKQAYHDITHGAGFFRHFFNLLKGVTGGQISGLTRLFITGVSPITMDDVTSGFNIGTNISLDRRFNEMIGLTETEVKEIVTSYHNEGVLPVSIETALKLMREWYDNYYFGQRAETSMYNSDMVLYFINQAEADGGVPDNLIDQNIRTDYGKLRHLMLVDSQIEGEKKLNGNFSQLQAIIEDGEVSSPINPSFPLEELLNRENFISLLYYFGLLSFTGITIQNLPLLRIPNRTVKDLMYGYMRSSLAAADMLKIDVRKLSVLIDAMAIRGEWRPFFDYLNNAVEEQTSIRDHLNAEKVFHGFLLAYLNVTHHFHTWSEREMGGGFVDLYLEPFVARFPNIQYGYLIELKYISQKEFDGEGGQEKFAQKVTDAEAQLRQYADDPRIRDIAGEVPLKKIALVYKGWQLAYAEEVMHLTHSAEEENGTDESSPGAMAKYDKSTRTDELS